MSSTNMGMPIPTVGTTTGPTWANNYNSSLTIVDAHDHTNGNGVPITPSGMNISSDLSFNSTSSATNLLKASFTSQSGALTGTNFLSFVSGNLYANDGSGNQIAITSGGGVAGSPGSIGSLAAPASATYSAGSKLFSWRADSGKAAAMDNGAVTIRETNVASAKGITLASPSSLAADYQLTLLTGLPGSTQYLSCDSSGNLATVTSDSIGSAMSSTGANAVAASRTRSTGTTVGAGGVAISSTCGSFQVNTGSLTLITNFSVTITISGRPVVIQVVSDGSGLGTNGEIQAASSGGSAATADFQFLEDGADIGSYTLSISAAGSTNATITVPSSNLFLVRAGASAGAHTYSIKCRNNGGVTVTAGVFYSKLVVYEL